MPDAYTTRTVRLPAGIWTDLRAIGMLNEQKIDAVIESICQQYLEQHFENKMAEWREKRKKEDAARQNLQAKAYAPLTDEGDF